jgi:DMSO/TMAO reductase YedYZ molybdopterin-dependent catalytic subunit
VSEGISLEELQLAARNHGMPLEALRHEITPPGLHYLLVHYDIPEVDGDAWRLTVDGRVRRPLELSLADIKARRIVSAPVTMECAGNGRARLDPRPISQPWLSEAVGTAQWTGTPLAPLLEEAGLLDSAREVVFTGLDTGVEAEQRQRYQRSLTIADALRPDVLLAYEMGGAPLPAQHGYPVRLLVPGWYGMTSVKWLERITVVDEPFTGYQQASAYRLRQDPDEPGTPLTRMEPRALMVPPGIPDFLTRRRFVDPGPHRLHGRAWSGWGPIERVEVSDDGGASWRVAELGEPPGPAAWTPWSTEWEAASGEYELCARAHDATGRSQPEVPPWNVGGYANNAVQRVPVTCSRAGRA